MEWINLKDKKPQKENESDVYTSCTCGIKNERVIHDAVYYHYENKFFHNQDTSYLFPIPATHWLILTPPKK